eukprot:TRINITY_DN9487_c0_g1_i2.p1 TRINITY_DN9487_c0_g1~~TRINITY_DN9487_c0_g1_i2.p1  ORF type:complete len:227 (-),score=31.02 TRINITY_DN9487_c0_g1_i2:36-716(-)
MSLSVRPWVPLLVLVLFLLQHPRLTRAAYTVSHVTYYSDSACSKPTNVTGYFSLLAQCTPYPCTFSADAPYGGSYAIGECVASYPEAVPEGFWGSSLYTDTCSLINTLLILPQDKCILSAGYYTYASCTTNDTQATIQMTASSATCPPDMLFSFAANNCTASNYFCPGFGIPGRPPPGTPDSGLSPGAIAGIVVAAVVVAIAAAVGIFYIVRRHRHGSHHYSEIKH